MMKDKAVIFSLVGLLVLLLGVAAFFVWGGIGGEAPVNAYLLVSIAVALVLFAVVFAALVKKGKIARRGMDYRTLFILGVIWLPIGIALENPGLWGMGVVFMIIGLVHRDKWEKRPRYCELPRAQRNLMLGVTILLGILVLGGLVAWYLAAQ